MHIALASCHPLPEPDPDEAPLLLALREAGHHAQTIVWTDHSADLSAFDAIVIRATWDYHRAADAFLAWTSRAAAQSHLLNSPDVVRWNAHKSYLADLEQRGVPIVPTHWIAQGNPSELSAVLVQKQWRDFVIKPAISCGSFRCGRFNTEELDDANALLRTITQDGDAMVQPYVRSIERGGERAIVWIDGTVTHVAAKSPRFHGADESIPEVRAPREDESAFARDVIDAAGFRDLLFARIDVMLDDQGAFMLSELELIEPSLYFPKWPAALPLMVRGIERRVAGAARSRQPSSRGE